MEIICAWCRSRLKLKGTTDLRAKGIQVLKCPVCGYKIWQASGLIPQRWQIVEIIERHKPPSAVPVTIQEKKPITTKPVWSEFKIITPQLQNLGIWVFAGLILVLLIIWRLK